MADRFDIRPGARAESSEAILKAWAKGNSARSVKPEIHKVTGRIEHVFTCREGGEVVATGRGQTSVGASRDACTQLKL